MVTKGKDWVVERRPNDQVPVYKRNQVEHIKDLVKQSKVIGIIGIKGIPGAQFQQMRKNLGNMVDMIVVRNNMLYLALKECGGENSKGPQEVDEFLANVDGQTALVTTNLNPFKLYKQLEATKTKAPAKGGEKAPDDVIVEEGETEFKAGPIVGDLQKVGIPAGIVSGKVVVKSTKTLVKAGNVIKKELASMLTRLGIFPLTVGLDLKAALEDNQLYRSDVLAVDEDLIVSQISTIATAGFNLSMFIGFPTSTTIKPMIAKAYRQALGLAMEAKVINKGSIGPILAKAIAQAMAIKARIEDLPDETPTEPDDDKDAPKGGDNKGSESDAAVGLTSLFEG